MIKPFMKNKIVTPFITLYGLILASPVLADAYGLDTAANSTGLKKTSIPAFVGSIIGIALSLLGVIFLILIVYGGFLWMTAYGDKTKLDKAKDLITNAVIGVIIVIAAYTISSFVIGALTK